MLHRHLFVLFLAAVAACSSSSETPDATVIDAAADAASRPTDPYACGDALSCTPAEYCMTFLPGACGGTPVDENGECPPGCALCPSGTDCACPSYSCAAIPDDCNACECVESAGSPECSCTAFGPDGVFMTCAGV